MQGKHAGQTHGCSRSSLAQGGGAGGSDHGYSRLAPGSPNMLTGLAPPAGAVKAAARCGPAALQQAHYCRLLLRKRLTLGHSSQQRYHQEQARSELPEGRSSLHHLEAAKPRDSFCSKAADQVVYSAQMIRTGGGPWKQYWGRGIASRHMGGAARAEVQSTRMHGTGHRLKGVDRSKFTLLLSMASCHSSPSLSKPKFSTTAAR